MPRNEQVPVFVLVAGLLAMLGLVALVVLGLVGGSEVANAPNGPIIELRVIERTGTDTVDEVVAVVEHRLASLGSDDASVSHASDRIEVRLGEDDDPQRVLTAIIREGRLNFRPVLEIDVDEPLTERMSLAPDVEVVLAELDRERSALTRHRLGPVEVTERGVIAAVAQFDQQGFGWIVALELSDDTGGIDAFNRMAQRCHETRPECPTGIVAMVFDDAIIASPVIQLSLPRFIPFASDQVTITGSFTQQEAVDMALVLRSGPLPAPVEVIGIR